MNAESIAGNVYDKYHAKNPIAKLLMKRFLLTIEDHIRYTRATDIHEVGCGEGYLSAFLAKGARKVRASDSSPEIIAKAGDRHLASVTFKVASVYELSPPDDAAELIVCSEVLEHLPEPERALDILCSLAKPYLLVSVPREPLWRILNMARGTYVKQWGNTPGHIQHWTRAQFEALVARHSTILRTASPLPWTVVLAKV